MNCRAPASPWRSAPNFSTPRIEGELIEATGEVTRAGKSLIFVRGILKSGERPLFTFSGTIKRVKRKVPPTEIADSH